MKTNSYRQNYVQTEEPTAHITFKKGRLKQNQNKVYLNDNSEFQIELFNGTTSEVLAKISLNGELISQGGIVLRPAERIFLDRYLDVAKKFKFETYDVSGKSEEVQNAIRNNGLVKVEFFRKQISICYGRLGNPIITTTPAWQHWSTPYCGTPIVYCGGSSVGSSFTTTSLGVNTTYTNSSSGTINLSDNTQTVNNNKKSKKTIETGRIGEGSKSDQEFRTVDMTFEYYAFKTFEYQILPTSQKVMESKDIKKYCPSCGTKCNTAFCPSCGAKQ